MDMFADDFIPNDLEEVDRAVCDYYDLNPPAPPRGKNPPAPKAPKTAVPANAQVPAGNEAGGV
jgi:hypothetical protein